MKILVPIKRVPDPYGRVGLTPDHELDLSDVKWVINPFDEIALEEAVRIRERGTNVEIVGVCVGGAESEPTLRNALAMGADRAILIVDESAADAGRIAFLLHAIAVRERSDVILMGKQAIDDDNNQIGQRLAARLKVPQATFASSVLLADDWRTVRVTREVDEGQETLVVKLPAVITTDLRLNEPRYVALPAILKARSKPLERIAASDLGAVPDVQMRVVQRETAPIRKPGRRVASVQELVDVLRNEAKVL